MRTLSQEKVVIFTAPQGWGKTFHAAKLQRAFGCDSVVDEWSPGMPLQYGALHLTNCRSEYVRDTLQANADNLGLGDFDLVDTAWTCSPKTYFGSQA